MERQVVDPHYAVVVVGAGPAGATAANVLCLGGVRAVALIDRARFPRDKACGDGITGVAVDVMRELALDHLLAPHPLVRKVQITAPSGNQALLEPTDGERPLPRAYVIPRKIFDNYLTSAALDRGAADLTGHKLDRAERVDGRWLLELAGEAPARERRRITADFMIGADGALSRVRRVLGIALNTEKNTGIAIRAYGTLAASQTTQLRLDNIDGMIRPGYAWLFSIGPHHVNVGFGTQLDVYKAQSQHLRDVLKFYASYLGNGLHLDEESAQSAPLPHASQLPRLALPEQRAALIGDAASMINSLTGEGISYGMVAGLLLGRELADAIARGGDLGAAAVRYEHAFRKRFAAHFRGNLILRWIARPRPIAERMVAGYQRNTDCYRDAIDFMLSGTPTISLPRLLWRGLTS
jgi:geranylgeranyl reductase family protein